MERWLLARSPLLLKFFDNVLGREVEVDFGGQECIMAQQALQRRQGDPFLDCRDGEGVPKYMRGDCTADTGAGSQPSTPNCTATRYLVVTTVRTRYPPKFSLAA